MNHEYLGSDAAKLGPIGAYPAAAIWEAIGLGGDVVIDLLKEGLGTQPEVGIWDEGYKGSTCPDLVQDVLRPFGVSCPNVYLPGLHEDRDGTRHVDLNGFQWLRRWLEGNPKFAQGPGKE